MSKPKPNFVKDLRRGNNAQGLVVELYDNCGLTSTITGTKDPNRQFWDIHSLPLDFTTEVKFDEYEAKSGNIAIEVSNPKLNKPSGLTITKADFWAHVLVNGVVWLVPTQKLKDYVQLVKPRRIIKCGGDNNAELLLYESQPTLFALFYRIDNRSPEELMAYILKELDGR